MDLKNIIIFEFFIGFFKILIAGESKTEALKLNMLSIDVLVVIRV